MKSVEPIRDELWRESFIEYFEKTSDRNLVLFLIGIYTGFRISDITNLRVRDVQGKTHLDIVEGKTGKRRKVFIHRKLKRPLERLIKNKSKFDYLFESRQRSRTGKKKAIERSTVDKFLKKAAIEIGYTEPIATHSMRKSFGHMYYTAHKDIADLQDMFNHSSPKITLRYIGMQQAKFDENVSNLK
ncbi:tyrosine-type recombinase/integrase [Psychrobacillus sp. FSL K6-2684]|uniref:tyrosine-type recombinase/integrase n=1 Tax=Psychrobacillus sp. FSL K6-2684 TaxID=2921547 RepID=UPI0030FA6F60